MKGNVMLNHAMDFPINLLGPFAVLGCLVTYIFHSVA